LAWRPRMNFDPCRDKIDAFWRVFIFSTGFQVIFLLLFRVIPTIFTPRILFLGRPKIHPYRP